jgi:3-oxoacyl-[acyl-carrier protein] reductase
MNDTVTFDLSDNVAIVTGGTGALGSSIVRGLINAGAAVVVAHYNDDDGVRRVADEHADASPRLTFHSCDVRDEQSVAALVAHATTTFGLPTILVNNAGIMDEKSIDETTLHDWQRTIDTNLTGAFLMTRAVVPAMRHAGGGCIVNVASQVPFRGGLNLVSYAAAKGGLVGMTRTLARELGPTIRINAIAPGPLDTPLLKPFLTPEWVEQRAGNLVTRQLGDVDDVAPTVLMLCSRAGRLYHGQTLHVNGGGVML